VYHLPTELPVKEHKTRTRDSPPFPCPSRTQRQVQPFGRKVPCQSAVSLLNTATENVIEFLGATPTIHR